MQVDFFTFKKEDFACPKCGWKGKGSDLSNGELNEVHSICDLNCPSCGEYIGFCQAPLKEVLDKWKKDNPDVDSG